MGSLFFIKKKIIKKECLLKINYYLCKIVNGIRFFYVLFCK